ncbi:MAG: pilus assembly protein N-terminal domain-containing protein, partial [Gemmatimonadaceae bacterium]
MRYENLMATPRARGFVVAVASLVTLGVGARASLAQVTVTPLAVMTGRSYPITFPAAVSKVSVTDAAIADVVVISDRELVVNAKTPGETDAIIYL